MDIYIRKKQGWINFISGIDELRLFIESYIPNTHILIGDISTFSHQMKTLLLKFVEDNPAVNCYASTDISDVTILSRCVHYIKEPLKVSHSYSIDEFKASAKSFSDIERNLSMSNTLKLRAYHLPNSLLNIITQI